MKSDEAGPILFGLFLAFACLALGFDPLWTLIGHCLGSFFFGDLCSMMLGHCLLCVTIDFVHDMLR